MISTNLLASSATLGLRLPHMLHTILKALQCVGSPRKWPCCVLWCCSQGVAVARVHPATQYNYVSAELLLLHWLCQGPVWNGSKDSHAPRSCRERHEPC
jgi:hypothetical protein